MATFRNLAIGLLKILGAGNIAKTTWAIRDQPERALPLLGITNNPDTEELDQALTPEPVTAVAYRADVEFLEAANPTLIERGAAEFTRLHMLIETTDNAFRKAAAVDWQSEARALYVKRLREAKELTDALSVGFRRAGKALSTYAEAVATAKIHYASGKTAEGDLAAVMSREATAVTPTARAAEPLKQWEDLRGTTGVLDWFAEVAVDIDEIREEAERYYNQTRDHYADARRIESQARETCTAELDTARRFIPTFNNRQTTLTPSCRARDRRSARSPPRATPWWSTRC
jgi:hypothetical protein